MTTSYSRTTGCDFQWKIENLSHCCWLANGVEIVSPTFDTDAVDGTKWSLHLFPMGAPPPRESDNSIHLVLEREKDYSDTRCVEVDYRLAFLRKDGVALKEFHKTFFFKRGERFGKQNFESQEKVFLTQRKEFLPEDALTVQCVVQEINEEALSTNLKHIYARTVFNVNRRYAFWKIEKFSTLNKAVKNKFKDNLIDLDLVLINNTFMLDVISFNNSIKYISVNISIIDSEGIKTNCGCEDFNGKSIEEVDDFPVVEYGKFNETSYYISRIREKLLQHKSRYMPNDVLSLSIEYVYSTMTNSYESFSSEAISPELTEEVIINNNEHQVGKSKSRNASFLADDLKSMYIDGIFSDTKLRTSSQTFSVHRGILSARSPVFCRMFNDDMQVKNSGHVDINDLEEDTVHRMLLFIYTDYLDLQLESAYRLYTAADKYEIFSLKSKCSSFLKDNLNPAKACEVLIFADFHQDEDLKGYVQAYILDHQEVFKMQEWTHLMENNLKLGADLMHRKIIS